MVSPILKWAGGKRWLVVADRLPKPSKYQRYVEPFLGSGAVFFHLKPSSAILSDLNADLINLYKVVRDNPWEFEERMHAHQAMHSKEYYYQIRAKLCVDADAAAARFLYLNRTCWNGLYRVNKRGEFNVPIGTKQAVVMSTDDFLAVSETLKRAELRNEDFEKIIDETQHGDFLFVDPPYTVQHNFNGFLKYNEQIFSWQDQIRLSNALQKAANRGVSIVLTNADHESVRQLYVQKFQYRKLARQSVLAGKSNKRGGTTEAIFTCNLEG
ncbi:DNA methyltransferase [Pararhizobium polonicum]|uniref:Site-specific DNA-methyltransferase (adenine-specific) n=1 Tax=Pararhizobium polonicum TaxID=1612624 RepID=A0A1C7NZ82_9HYPH|nr:Dam family site-specific DNA-(adenine-N6)-methyltransferase [Pararhizobium polonicum]OBZ94325.1 DNA methyltransferase [Pararhizobium polonicum]